MSTEPQPAEAMTVEQASARRGELMTDAGWRAKAMNNASAEWAEITRLDGILAAAADAEASDEAENGPAPAKPQQPEPSLDDGEGDGDEEGDGEIPHGFYDPPESPGGYDLPTSKAKTELGLEVDAAADIDLRKGLHAAGVDQRTARGLYSIAMYSVKQELTPISLEAERRTSESLLRGQWGDKFDANLKLANDEGLRIFEKLPASVTQGMSYAEFAVVTGIANNKVAVEMLYRRAQRMERIK